MDQALLTSWMLGKNVMSMYQWYAQNEKIVHLVMPKAPMQKVMKTQLSWLDVAKDLVLIMDASPYTGHKLFKNALGSCWAENCSKQLDDYIDFLYNCDHIGQNEMTKMYDVMAMLGDAPDAKAASIFRKPMPRY
eukprot:10428889-Lingulodinium_polyedra.AAC.1